jgi:hypothetical protein
MTAGAAPLNGWKFAVPACWLQKSMASVHTPGRGSRTCSWAPARGRIPLSLAGLPFAAVEAASLLAEVVTLQGPRYRECAV